MIDAERRIQIGLAIVLATGLLLRLWGISFGLPHPYCRPDETTLLHKAMGIGTGDLNPHFFNYPSLYFYFLAVLYGFYFSVGYVLGIFTDLETFQIHFFTDPSYFFLVGRICSAALGTMSVLLIYHIGRYLATPQVGLLSSFFLSLAFLHVRESHFLTVDIPATFLMLLASMLALRYLTDARLPHLIFSAFVLGLAASTKYNLALFGIGILVVAALPLNKEKDTAHFSWKCGILVGVFMGVGFLMGTPFALLDFPTFWRDLTYERQHFAVGHGLDLGRGWIYHLLFTLPDGLGWPLLLMGLVGCFFLLRNSKGWAILSGIFLYYLVAGSGKTVFVRYMLPLIPLLCASAALAVEEIRRRWLGKWAFLLIVFLAIPSGHASYAHSRLLTREDTRLQAGKWIEQHIPSGTRIALQGSDYGYPLVRRSRQWIVERLEDERRSGQTAKRLARQLQWPHYPPKPNYYVVEVKQENLLQLRSIWKVDDVDQLQDKGIFWVVTQQHPLYDPSGDGSLLKQLDEEWHLVESFDPFIDGVASLVYDPIDSYYVPLSGFSGVERPGPTLHIYHFKGKR